MSDKQYPHLLPCPFCGETAKTHVNLVDQDGIAWVTCTNCNAEGPTTDTAEQAVESWNRRAQRLPLTEGWIEKNIGTSTSMLSAVVRHVVRKVEAAHGISTPPRPDATTEGEDK